MDPNNSRIKWITLTVFLIGIVMIGFGIARGEPLVVLRKAAVICMQCIGIN